MLLTYHGVKDLTHWRRFVQHVKDHLRKWRVKHWCATLELTKAGKLHTHLKLNPVEKFWSWLRRHLRAMDLKDAMAKRPVLGKMAYRERLRRVVKSVKARTVAINTLASLRKTCKEVIKKKGAATRG